VKNRFKRKRVFDKPRNKPGLIEVINKVQQQLSAMEQKLDILISQSSKRPFEKSYSQESSRRFDHSHRHDSRRQGTDHRERTYTRVICADCNKECEIPFKPSGDRPVYCKDCFASRRKENLFNANRDTRSQERDFTRERRPDKRHAEKRQKPGKKKVPFYARRKKRA